MLVFSKILSQKTICDKVYGLRFLLGLFYIWGGGIRYDS